MKRQKTGGRQPGSPNRTTAATRERIEALGDPLGFLTSVMNGEKISAGLLKDGGDAVEVVPTLDQRISAAAKLADKLVPNARSKPIQITLPKIEKPEDIAPATAVVLTAVSAGQITPDEGKQLADMVEVLRAGFETADLARRIALLEQSEG